MVIISPTFLGDGTGVSTYYGLLTAELRHLDVPVTVISARHDGPTPPGYIGAFGFQTDVAAHRLVRARRYIRKNLDYLKLPALLQRFGRGPVLVHANFYTRPSLFPWLLASIQTSERRFIVDVRDPHTPPERARHFRRYERVIACSDNVVAHLRQCGVPDETIVSIPVMQSEITLDPERSVLTGEAKALSERRYIFFGGAIGHYKAVDRLLEMFTEHVRPRAPGVDLVLAGPLKTADPTMLGQLAAPGVHYLGSRTRPEVLELMAHAALCIHLSPNEGMPRSCLEALALRRPVVLPPNVPEFTRYCPDFVASDPDPARIAAQVLEQLNTPRLAPYPLERHLPHNVMPAYLNVLGYGD